jgi:REP element-mobilizing transposase RayT
MDESQKRPRSRELRKGRYSIPGQIYLVTTATAGRKPLFKDMRLGRQVILSFMHQHRRGLVNHLAYVIMPDHFHWLFELGVPCSLSQVVGGVKSYSAKRVNSLAGNAGMNVWQPGFHDRALRREEDVRSVARYIVANPIRAGLVDDIGRYPLWDAVWVG